MSAAGAKVCKEVSVRSNKVRHYRKVFGVVLLLIVSGCVSSSRYDHLLVTHRDFELNHRQQIESLSRENKVFYEAKVELDKEVSLLKDSLENSQVELDAERENDASYRDGMRQKVNELERQNKNLEEKNSRKIQELNRQNREAVDSLVQQIGSVSAQLSANRKACSIEIQLLKNELAKNKFEYEKELYALTRVKEEVFAKLQDNQRQLDELRLSQRPPHSQGPVDSAGGK